MQEVVESHILKDYYNVRIERDDGIVVVESHILKDYYNLAA